MDPAKQHDQRSKRELSRRDALVAGAAATPFLAAAVTQVSAADPQDGAVGPILGHVDHETAIIWYRPAIAGEYVATITNTKTRQTQSASAKTGGFV